MKGTVDLQLPEFPASLLPRIDRYRQLLEEANPGVTFSRTACVTSLVARVLAEIEERPNNGRRKGSERRQGRRGRDRRQFHRRWRDIVIADAHKQVVSDLRSATKM
ncbi:MAG: hypothetical protein ACREF4_14345 [Gammaproteobacteria bacterium]